MSGLSHVSVGVNDLRRARAFYDPLMHILGLTPARPACDLNIATRTTARLCLPFT